MLIWNSNNNKWSHYKKQWQNSDLRETKQNIYHSKGIDESYSKICFLLNLCHCVKRYRHFCQIWLVLWCPLTSVVMSSDPRCTFRKFLICPNSTFNIRKSQKISGGKALCFRGYEQKISWRVNPPPPQVPLGLICSTYSKNNHSLQSRNTAWHTLLFYNEQTYLQSDSLC